MKIVDLLNAQPVVQALTDRMVSAKLAYGLAKNFRMITQDLEVYDKARLKLLQDNWELDRETNKYKIPDEDQKKWQDLHAELLQAEAGYQPYKIDLALTESIEMTPGELLAIWFMFDNLHPDPGPAAAPDPGF